VVGFADDFDRIPFGMNEGVGLSDPSVLSQTYFWSTDQIVHRYVALGCVCLAVLAISYALALLRSAKTESLLSRLDETSRPPWSPGCTRCRIRPRSRCVPQARLRDRDHRERSLGP